MEPYEFEALEPHLDQINEQLDAALQLPEFQKIRESLTRIGKSLGERYTINFTCLVEVFDASREQSLPLLTTGLSTSGNGEPYQVWGDSTPERYIIDGDMRMVPHDRCPKCWGVWDFKWDLHHCNHCDAALGTNCKILLDSDVCPHCEMGQVTASRPVCTKCGYVVNPAFVVWG